LSQSPSKETNNKLRTDGRTEEKNGERISPGKWDRALSPLPRIDLLLPVFIIKGGRKVTNVSGRGCCDFFADFRTLANFTHLKKESAVSGWVQRAGSGCCKQGLQQGSFSTLCLHPGKKEEKKKKRLKEN